MNPTKQVLAVSYFGWANTREDETSDVVSIQNALNDTSSLVLRLIGNIIVSRNDPTNHLYHITWAISRVTAHGKIDFYLGPNDPPTIDLTVQSLNDILIANQTLRQALQTPQNINGVVAYYVTENLGNATISIQRVVVDSPPTCAACNEVVIYEPMAEHIIGSSCLTDATNNASEASGYVVLDQEREYSISKTTKVPWKMVPCSFDMQVPKWVINAIDTYEKHNGFAGLTLEDYLDKMADNQVK